MASRRHASRERLCSKRLFNFLGLAKARAAVRPLAPARFFALGRGEARGGRSAFGAARFFVLGRGEARGAQSRFATG
jgi:hypothetical protein